MTGLPVRSVLKQPLPPVPPDDPADNIWKPPSSGASAKPAPPLPSKAHDRSVSVGDNLYQNSPSRPPQTKLRSRTIGETSPRPPMLLEDDDYENADEVNIQALPSRISNSPRHMRKTASVPVPERNDVEGSSEDMKASIKFMQSLVDAVKENTQKEMKALRTEMQREISELRETVQQLKTQVESQSKPGGKGSPSLLGKFRSSQTVHCWSYRI